VKLSEIELVSKDESFALNKIKKLEFDETNILKIKATFPDGSVDLNFDRYESEITAYSKSLEIKGVVSEITNIIEKNSFIGGSFYGHAIFISTITLFWGFLAILIGFLVDGQDYAYLGAICFFISSFTVLFLINHKTTIYLKRKKELPGFWRRKKEDILINFTIGSVMLVAGVLLGKHFN